MKFDWHLTVVRFVMAGISYYQISKPQNAIPRPAIEGGLFTRYVSRNWPWNRRKTSHGARKVFYFESRTRYLVLFLYLFRLFGLLFYFVEIKMFCVLG